MTVEEKDQRFIYTRLSNNRYVLRVFEDVNVLRVSKGVRIVPKLICPIDIGQVLVVFGSFYTVIKTDLLKPWNDRL